jgi:hypothetical protein
MPFNPGVYDRSGEIIAAGISSATDAISRGIAEHRKEKKRKEEEDAAIEFLRRNGARFGVNVTDEKELSATVKAAGGGPQALQVFSAMQQAEERKAAAAQHQQLVAAQIADAEQRRADATRTREALLGAMNGAEGEAGADGATVLDYLRRGGNVQGAAQLAETIGSLDKMRQGREVYTPELVDLGNGVTAMKTSRNSAVPITKGEPRTPSAGGPQVSPDGRFFLDDKTQSWKPMPRAAAEKLIDPIGWEMAKSGAVKAVGKDEADRVFGRHYGEYQEMRKKGGAAEQAGDEPSAAAGNAPGGSPVNITTKAQFDALPKGQLFVFQGKTGIKK